MQHTSNPSILRILSKQGVRYYHINLLHQDVFHCEKQLITLRLLIITPFPTLLPHVRRSIITHLPQPLPVNIKQEWDWLKCYR